MVGRPSEWDRPNNGSKNGVRVTTLTPLTCPSAARVSSVVAPYFFKWASDIRGWLLLMTYSVLSRQTEPTIGFVMAVWITASTSPVMRRGSEIISEDINSDVKGRKDAAR